MFFVTRILFALWFGATLWGFISLLSRFFFDPTFGLRKMLPLAGFVLIWPVAVFSEEGRKKLNNILEKK